MLCVDVGRCCAIRPLLLLQSIEMRLKDAIHVPVGVHVFQVFSGTVARVVQQRRVCWCLCQLDGARFRYRCCSCVHVPYTCAVW